MSPVTLGYCTNVHGGATLDEMKCNLEKHAVAVRNLYSPSEILPIGLWLSSRALHALGEIDHGACDLRDWLHSRGLSVFTLNGFPYGDFHQAVVKHAVYEPHWAQAGRLLFTTQLADVLVDLLPSDATEGSISTLPIGWKSRFELDGSGSSLGRAAMHLRQLVRHLANIEQRTGKCLHVDLEPEPGCVLQRSADVSQFFNSCLSQERGEPEVRRYLRVCHDVCHAAVMFEEQADALAAYRDCGVRVGKVQVSSALTCTGAPRALRALRDFDEPKWLHQTCVLDGQGAVHFYEDLDRAFDHAPDGVWRTHFHVPVHLESVGLLGTTQQQIHECFGALSPQDGVSHVEVETYAWGAMPMNHRPQSLAHGITDELLFTRSAMRAE
ncbi:MAG: hypothetical protein EXS00_03685 [Phycisphaerales bacterium]|nr:hypothetical protein [Phycisphaerales bacterium]